MVVVKRSLPSCFATFSVCTWYDLLRATFNGAVLPREDDWCIDKFLRAGVCRATLLFLGLWTLYAWPGG